METDKPPTLANHSMSWALPSHIIAFLANAIENLHTKKFKLMPWPEFKKLLFEIYDHRVEHAPEISGAVNNSYMPLDEHLVVFMCQTTAKHNAPGSREAIEHRLLEFLYSLKYYCQRWPRAKLYAQMVGFLKDHIDLASNKDVIAYREENDPTFKARVDSEGREYVSRQIESDLKDHNDQFTQVGLPTTYDKAPFFRAHMEQVDGNLNDLEIPFIDIFLQEFFFFAYTFITRDRKGFHESREGNTYIKLNYEHRQSQKIINFLYGDRERDVKKWQKQISSNIKRIRVNPLDEQDTDFIDLDLMLKFYVDEYQKLRIDNRDALKKAFQDFYVTESRPVGIKDFRQIMMKVIPDKSPSPSLYFAKDMTFTRAFLYAYSCDKNDYEIKVEQFLAACSRFGLDSPIPIISKRLNIFGNVEEIDKDFRRILNKFKNAQPENTELSQIDPDIHTTTDFKTQGNVMAQTLIDIKKRNQTYDFKETAVKQPIKKTAGFVDMNFIAPNSRGQSLGQGTAPSEYNIGGVKMSIKDIKRIPFQTEEEDSQSHSVPGSARHSLAPSAPIPPEQLQLLKGPSSLIKGMSFEAFKVYSDMKYDLTKQEFGISDKKLIIPSFHTTSKLFAQHLAILRDLRHKIELLKQAYEYQRSEKRSWEQIDAILNVIEVACKFLDFPENLEEEIRQKQVDKLKRKNARERKKARDAAMLQPKDTDISDYIT